MIERRISYMFLWYRNVLMCAETRDSKCSTVFMFMNCIVCALAEFNLHSSHEYIWTDSLHFNEKTIITIGRCKDFVYVYDVRFIGVYLAAFQAQNRSLPTKVTQNNRVASSIFASTIHISMGYANRTRRKKTKHISPHTMTRLQRNIAENSELRFVV